VPEPQQQREPHDVVAIRREVERALNLQDAEGRATGNAKWGAYCFYDYDEEPIYVGQTSEQLRVRIRRHLTNQRTDAVAMSVLDPFEVCFIEMWPLWDLQGVSKNSGTEAFRAAQARLNALEYSAFQYVLESSALGAVLNEKNVAPTATVPLPPSSRARIIPDAIYNQRKHPDVRIARRASTIAALAKVISERAVSPGLRRTLLTQARRLERLAHVRLEELGGEPMPVEAPGEET
jgi:hypothetical protein